MRKCRNGGERRSRSCSMPMSPDKRGQIVEEILHLKDLLHEENDEILNSLCERMLNRMDVLSGADMEDYD